VDHERHGEPRLGRVGQGRRHDQGLPRAERHAGLHRAGAEATSGACARR
jgi:hypothetical protein